MFLPEKMEQKMVIFDSEKRDHNIVFKEKCPFLPKLAEIDHWSQFYKSALGHNLQKKQSGPNLNH
jgi:hypothetical protein